MAAGSDTQWVGTPQHPNAADLSRFLIHMTRSEADLASILTQGVLEARAVYGIASHIKSRADGQRTICFTEMPLAELTRMASRGRVFGIVFSKEKLRDTYGAQPVWYISEPSPEHSAMRELMKVGKAVDSAVWKITPFIEGVRSTNRRGGSDWRWEREWRVLGDLRFELDDIAAVLIPTPEGEFEPITDISLGVPFITPDGEFFWSGAFVEATDAAMELLVERFYENWTTPDGALLPLDRESRWGYAEVAPIYELDDAIYSEFEDFPAEVRSAISLALQDGSMLWCRVADAEQAYE